MLHTEQTTIEGIGYKVTQLPYTPGHRLLLRLGRVLGPAFAQAIANAPELEKGVQLAEIKVSQLAPAFSAALNTLLTNLSDEDFDFAIETLSEYTEVSTERGKWVPLKSTFELHFAGKYSELFRWLGFALKVNYGGFFKGQGNVSALSARLKEALAGEKSKYQTSSIGTSTESPPVADTQVL